MGEPGGYRVWVHNPTAGSRRFTVLVRGWRGEVAEPAFEVAWDVVLGPRASAERWVKSSWDGDASLVSDPLPDRAVALGTRPAGRWRVEARVEGRERCPAHSRGVRRVKILHVVPRYPPAAGGAETWCAGVARWQARHGHAVRVLALRAVTDDELWGDHWSGAPRLPGPVAVGPEDVGDGVSVRRCAFSPTSFAVARLLSRLGLETFAWCQSAEVCGRVVREARRADAIHAHWAPGLHAVLAWVAARAARRPFVLTLHFHAGDRRHEQRAVQWILRHSDRVIAVTGTEAETLRARGVRGDRIVRASNAIDPAALAPSSAARDAVRRALAVPPGAPLVCYRRAR